MNKHSELLGMALVVIGILALISGLLLEESLLLGTGFLLPSLAVLLWGRGNWFDELSRERKTWVSVVLAVAGATMIVFGCKNWDTTTFSLKLVGESILVLAGIAFFLLGASFSALSIGDWLGKMERSEHNRLKEK
jgi:hypothetical protein